MRASADLVFREAKLRCTKDMHKLHVLGRAP